MGQRAQPEHVRDHAAYLRLNPLTVGAAALRWRSREALDLVSLLATKGRGGHEVLVSEARRILEAGDLSAAGPLDGTALAAAARASLGWVTAPGSVDDSAALFRVLRMVDAAGALKPLGNDRAHVDRLDLQSNLLAGQTGYVDAIDLDALADPELRYLVSTELAHPERGRPGGTWEGWLAEFNRVLPPDATPVTLASGDGRPFDRIVAARPSRPRTGGPLVSVVMSIFQPDESLLTAVRSLVDQTWTNLEILLLDDCSPESYQPLIEQAAALDERITLHRMPTNGGTYRIRNAAIAMARGEFIAFQDSDDWSHPERIERQLGPMLDDPDVVATTSMSVRVGPDLSLVKLGFSSTRRCIVSLLMRRDPVVPELGSFDEVRKSGDSEWLERLGLVFGADRLVPVEETLVVYQLTEGSLSRRDFELGWREQMRRAYVEAYERWHREIAAGRSTARLEPGERRFVAPPAFLTGRTTPTRHDVVVVSDWMVGRSRHDGVAEEVAALADAGLSCAILQAETIRSTQKGHKPFRDEAAELWTSGEVTWARWADPVTAGLVLVRDPELLSYPPDPAEVSVRAERLVVHAAFGPRTPEGGWRAYDPVFVEQRARELFGAEVEWLPATPAVAEALRVDGASGRVLEPAPLGVAASTASGRAWTGRPVVGATDLEALQRDRLTAEELCALLPRDERIDVRLRDVNGALDTRTAPKPLPATWQRADDEALEDFLDTLDVLVCLPRRTVGPELQRAALLAAARGVVVLAPTALAAALGPAAVDLAGRDVADVVLSLAADPASVAAHQEAGRRWAEERLSPEAYVVAVRALLA